MKKIFGFTDNTDTRKDISEQPVQKEASAAVKSVVRVYFPARNITLSYYNDKFDLHEGDLVYVEGSLQGLLGRVTDVSRNFKIKLSDYKKIIAVIDCNVKGRLYNHDSYFLAFDRNVLPKEKALLLFKAPDEDDEEYMTGDGDDHGFQLETLEGMDISEAIASRGISYFLNDKVVYLSLDGENGYAIVEGNEAYEVEFRYCNGDITELFCTCPCYCNCKHEYATLLLLRETLKSIEKNYSGNYCGYFCAIKKTKLLTMLCCNEEAGFIEIN